jgi:hypothetical protein
VLCRSALHVQEAFLISKLRGKKAHEKYLRDLADAIGEAVALLLQFPDDERTKLLVQQRQAELERRVLQAQSSTDVEQWNLTGKLGEPDVAAESETAAASSGRSKRRRVIPARIDYADLLGQVNTVDRHNLLNLDSDDAEKRQSDTEGEGRDDSEYD